jgi:hypothetical protein
VRGNVVNAEREESMTSSEPLTDLVLDTIRSVPAGTFFASDLADELETERIRGLSPGERLEQLNELMLRAERLRVSA